MITRSKVFVVRCGTRQGAGFLYRDSSHVITSLSVAGCGREIVILRHPKDKGIRAVLKAYTSTHDLALLKLPLPLKTAPVPRSNDPLSFVGERVALIGHPYNPSGSIVDRLKSPLAWSLNVGVLGRVTKDYLQVQLFRVDGFSGAPIFDRQGRVLGMLTTFGPSGKPIGMCVRLHQMDALFETPNKRQGYPFFSFEIHLHARFSLALGSANDTNISPSNQELRADLIFYDQWDIGVFIGFDLLGLRSDLDLSLLGGVSFGHRFIMPRFVRPYLNYITLELGALFMLLQLATKGQDVPGGPTVDNIELSSSFRVSLWLGLRFYSVAGQFSVGVFFDMANVTNLQTPLTPVLSISWGL